MKTVEEYSEEPNSPSLEDCLQTQIKTLKKNLLDEGFEELDNKLLDQDFEEQDEELDSKLLDEDFLEQSDDLIRKSLEKRIKKIKFNEKPLDTLSSYYLLNLNEADSQEEIKKRYKELAQIAHPDKGGNEVIFNAIENAYRNLYKDKPEDENNDENDKEDEQIGLHLIIGGYTPYISHPAFCNLKIEAEQKELTAEQKELVLLLGRQRRIYCKELISKYKGIDLKSIDAIAINFNSVDLDSVYLSPENQEKIVYLSQKANLSCHSLNGMQAITTEEDVSLDSPGLYLMGWKLLHEEPGIDSGAVELFKTWNRDRRKKLAIVLGNKKTNHSTANIIQILEMHDPLKNTSMYADLDRVIGTSFRTIA